MNKEYFPEFKEWFFKGIDDKPGYKRMLTWKLIKYIFIGIALSLIVNQSIIKISSISIIPLLSVLLGVTFAWIGNSHMLMVDKNVLQVISKRKGGLIEYLYTYQLAVLILLIILVFNILNGLEFYQLLLNFIKFKIKLNMNCISFLRIIYKTIIFSSLSYSVAIVWEIITISQWFYIIKSLVDKEETKKSNINN